MAHPVRPDSYVEINNFYTSTVYEKGAEVVRMMQALVGRDGFERGMTLYFQRHDGQAVTCDDFAQAIADANPGSPLAAHLDGFKRWYAQAGTPRITARGRYDAPSRTYTLGLEQRGEPSPGQPHKQPFVIPVAMGLVGRDGRPLPLRLEGEAAPVGTERVLVLDGAQAYFTFVDVDVEPVPSLLRGFSAPVCLSDGLHDAELLVLLAHDTDPFNRWEAGQRLALNRMLVGALLGQHAAARRTLRGGHASGAAPPDTGRGVQGTGAHAAVGALHRRAGGRGRPAAHPHRARVAAGAARGAHARRLDLGLGRAPGEGGLCPDAGAGRPPGTREPRALDAVPALGRARRTRSGPAAPTSASRTPAT